MGNSERRPDILLISADRRSRALLLAELQEAGYNVIAVPSLEVTLAALANGRLNPAMVVLDVHGDPNATPHRIGQLLNFLEEDIPLALIGGAYDDHALSPLRERVALWLSRPLRVGDILTAIRRLAPPPTETSERNHEAALLSEGQNPQRDHHAQYREETCSDPTGG